MRESRFLDVSDSCTSSLSVAISHPDPLTHVGTFETWGLRPGMRGTGPLTLEKVLCDQVMRKSYMNLFGSSADIPTSVFLA
jgi:hypothetical protein